MSQPPLHPLPTVVPPPPGGIVPEASTALPHLLQPPAAPDLQGYATAAPTAPAAIPVQPMSMQAHIQAQIQFQAQMQAQAQQAQLLQTAQLQAQLQAQAQLRALAFMQQAPAPPPAPVPKAPVTPAPPRGWGKGQAAPPRPGQRPLSAAQRAIRDGDFQVQRQAGLKAAEQVQEAYELATWAQKQLARASQQAELVLEKATQSQEYQQQSRAAAPSERSLEVQQQQVWMQQLSNELFNEAASIGDQILAQAESAVGTAKSAVAKVVAACEPLQALARQREEAMRVSKAQQLAQQADQRCSANLPAVERCRERMQAARDDRDRAVLIAACQQVKITVAESTGSSTFIFQAVQLAQQAAPASRTETGDGSTDGSGFYSFASSKAMVSSTVQKPLPGPEREVLPIDEHRDEIVRTIRERRVTCIQGETGCGKSSRVPQYVYHLCRPPPKRSGDPERLIVCTQPRRLAAISLAQRVAKEMGESNVGGLVGFRIAGESAFEPRRTRLLFVTAGYLLQVLVHDPGQIHRYSHVILDEAHERSVDADLLSLVLKLQLQHKLADFKIVIMSATLQGGIFSRYFQDEGDRTSPPAPIFVGVKRYHLDTLYLDELAALKTRVDPQDLAATTLEELRQRTGLGLTGPALDALNAGLDNFRTAAGAAQRRAMEAGGEPSEPGVVAMKPQLQRGFPHLLLELVRILGLGGEGILIFLPGMEEISEVFDVLEVLEQPPQEQSATGSHQPPRKSACEFKIFSLHGTIPIDEQEQAFSPPSENVCHIFLASSIAESSVTLPKVRVVIDACLRRQLAAGRSEHGVRCLLTQWVSHAAASQRSGRAGRVFPGVAIRLVPRSFYMQQMAQYDPPEIEQAPLEKLYLNVKQLSHRFSELLPRLGALPARRLLQLTVQPPPGDRLEDAVCTLVELGALTSRRDEQARITILGRMAIVLPLDLRLCRLVLFGALFGCAADAVVMAAALSGQDPFSSPMHMVIKDHLKYARALAKSFESRWHFDGGALSEPIMLRNLFKAWLKGLSQEGEGTLGSRLRVQLGASQRSMLLKHSQEFAKDHAVMPKRLTHLALSVVEIAQRTLEFLAPNTPEPTDGHLPSPSRRRLEALLAALGVQPPLLVKDANAAAEPQALKLDDVFSEDQLLLQATLTASFAPFYAHGITRCMDYTSALKGPQTSRRASKSLDDVSKESTEDQAEAQVVMLKADPQIAKVHGQALTKADVLEPKSFFILPQIPDALAQQPTTDSLSFSLRELSTAGGAKFKKLFVHQGQAYLTFDGKPEDDAASEDSIDEEICPPESLVKEVQERLQLPSLEELEDEERRRKRSQPSSSSESAKRRKRRREEEEAAKSERAASKGGKGADAAGKGQASSKGKGEWQWSTVAKRDESDNEAEKDNRDDAKEAERDKEKERRKEKEKERRKEKEKEKEREKDKDKAKKEKARKTKAKKKREEESYSYSSSSDESRSRRRKKKKKEVKKKKKAQDKKKKRKDGDCLLEIGSSSSGDLEIVAETSGPILALANSTPPEPPTMETAFEEVTDEQREKQRRRLERFRAMQAGLTEGEGENETKEAPTRLEVKASDGDSVLAKLRAQADKTDAQEKDEKAEGKAAEDEKSATSEGEDEGEEGGEQASPAAQAEKGEKTAAEEESAEEPAGSKEDEATEPNVEDSAASSPAVRSKEQKDQEKKAAAPSGEAGEGDEEVGSPVDVNEPDLKWERKTKTKAPKPGDRKRGVQFGGAAQVETEKGTEGSEDGSETELFQDLKATKATEATQAAAETPAVPAPEDDFANFLDEIKELDALTGQESSGDKMEELLQSEEGLNFKENEPQPTKADEANSPAQSKDGQEATTSDEKPSEEEVKEEAKKEEAAEIKDELKDEGEDAKQEAEAKEMKAEEEMKEEEEDEEQVKEEVKEEDVEMQEETVGSEAKAEQTSEDAPEVEPKEEEEQVELEEAPVEKEEEKEEAEKEMEEAKEAPMEEDAKEDKAEKDEEEDEMANFLEGIEQIEEAKSKEEEKAKEDTSMEVDAGIEVPAEADAEPQKPMEQEGKDEHKEAGAAPDPTEDEDMTAFLQGIEQIEEQKPDDADRSSDGKADDSTILESGEGTPCGTEGGATESAEDDFAAFLGALDDMEEKKDGKADEEAADEGDGLDDLPAVEIKRRLRAEGVAIPKGPEDKEELVTLLRETLNKPKGDAFMDFLSEIDKIQPAADVEMKEAAPEESAFADFLKEIDGMPTAEATPAPPKKTERPLTIRYDADGRKWVVFVAPDKELEEFPAQASPVRARRQALDFCRTTLLEMEKRGEVDKLEDEAHKSELAKILEEIKARPSGKTLLRGLDFNCLHLLVQYANGKSSFHWPVKVRQALGNRHAQSYTAEVEQKFELHRPIHPFQLAWRVCLDRSAGMSTFGTGNFRNPAGLVVSCPSRKSYVRLQKHQAKQAIEIAAAQRKLQQEQQQRLEDLLATAAGEDEIAAITKKVAAETKAALAAQEEQLCSYTRFTRRLERLAVFAGAQGREDNSSQVQLEGLSVLPNVDGSNALPVLLLLAFFRPRTCGGIFSGGCSALCDLDSLQVRAISLFGRSEESRWVLPITGRQKLTLSDLQHVNTLRQAVSTAFEVDDDAAGKEQGKDRKDSAKPGARPRGRRIYIKEDTETTRALGLLLGSVGGGRCPFDVQESTASSSSSDAKGKAGGSTGSGATKAVEEAKPDASKPSKDVSADGKKGRLLGDVWIDIAEEGAAEEALGERDFLREPTPGGAASGVFLSFEDLGKETADPAADAAMPSPEAPPTPGKAEAGDAPRFAFLPELSLSQALKERADSFLAMQTEVREFLTTGRPDVKAANDRVRKLRKNAKWLDTFKDKSSFAWTQAMNAEEPMQVKQAMGAATRIMQELSAAFAEVEVASGFVKDLFQMSEGRLQRAESCNKLAPHIWANAVRATRLMHEKLTMQWRMAAAILKHADASKRVSYKKADETVRLVNEKLLRWKEEAEILQQEAREDEMARQAALRMGAPRPSPVEVERQHADMARQRQELERQRMQAIQWGRHLVQPIPQMQFLPPKKAAAKAYAAREESARSATPSEEWSRVPPPSTSASEVPPPPGDQPAWAPQPPGPPP